MTKQRRWLVAVCVTANVVCASAEEPLRMTLQQIFATAETNNASILSFKTAMREADEGVAAARSARRPDLEATASVSYLGNVTSGTVR